MRPTFLVHLKLLNLTILIISGEEYKLRNSSQSNFLQPSVGLTASVLPEYSPQHPFLEHTRSHPSLNVRDQVSHRYKTTGKTVVLHTFIFKF
jgi:hypothetical protein